MSQLEQRKRNEPRHGLTLMKMVTVLEIIFPVFLPTEIFFQNARTYSLANGSPGLSGNI
jgi:hypothetical protein